MPKVKSWTYASVAALDRNGISLSQTPAAGGVQSLTITGALASGGVATPDVPRHVGVYSGSDISGRVFTITGTDRHDRAISETITGVNAGTVAGQLNFKTITSVTVDDDTGAAVEVGTVDSFDTPWYPMDRYRVDFPFAVGGDLNASANLTWGLEFAYENVRTVDGDDDITAHAHGTVTGKSADFHAQLTEAYGAVRFAISSYVAGGGSFYVKLAP